MTKRSWGARPVRARSTAYRARASLGPAMDPDRSRTKQTLTPGRAGAVAFVLRRAWGAVRRTRMWRSSGWSARTRWRSAWTVKVVGQAVRVMGLRASVSDGPILRYGPDRSDVVIG